MSSRGACHRCGRGGHLARDCSLHTCFRCNGRGHMAWQCAEGITCSRCGEKGHLQRNCRNIDCHRCGRKGHISKYCNDPFAKAAEVEKLEWQQTLFQARAMVSSGAHHAEGSNVLTTLTYRGASGLAKGAPGPWDGLGYSKAVPLSKEKERVESMKGVDSDSNTKLSKSSHSCSGNSTKANNVVQDVLHESGSRKRPSSVEIIFTKQVKVLGIKRKEVPRFMKLRLPKDPVSEIFTPKLESADAASIAQKTHSNVAGDLEWRGLIDYESEGSGASVESFPESGDEGSEKRVEALR